MTVTAARPSAPPSPQPIVRASPGAAVSGAATVLVGAAGVALGVAAITRPLAALRVGWLLPLAGVSFEVTGTAGLFMVVTGAVAVAAGCYSVGYFRHAKTAMATLSVLPLFVLTMIGVLAASSVTTLLVMWELMALVSLVAVLSDHHHAAVRDAGRWYAGMTQFGFLAILIGLVVLVHSGGSESLSVLAARAGAAPSCPVFLRAWFLRRPPRSSPLPRRRRPLWPQALWPPLRRRLTPRRRPRSPPRLKPRPRPRARRRIPTKR